MRRTIRWTLLPRLLRTLRICRLRSHPLCSNRNCLYLTFPRICMLLTAPPPQMDSLAARAPTLQAILRAASSWFQSIRLLFPSWRAWPRVIVMGRLRSRQAKKEPAHPVAAPMALAPEDRADQAKGAMVALASGPAIPVEAAVAPKEQARQPSALLAGQDDRAAWIKKNYLRRCC